mgnify:CR=1 FL=1
MKKIIVIFLVFIYTNNSFAYDEVRGLGLSKCKTFNNTSYFLHNQRDPLPQLARNRRASAGRAVSSEVRHLRHQGDFENENEHVDSGEGFMGYEA